MAHTLSASLGRMGKSSALRTPHEYFSYTRRTELLGGDGDSGFGRSAFGNAIGNGKAQGENCAAFGAVLAGDVAAVVLYDSIGGA